MPLSTDQALHVSGTGLVTGKPVDVEIRPAEKGHGIVFYMDGATPIPARLEAVVHTDRGVTLANREGKTLSIVEHFLCAAMLAGLPDLWVSVSGAPELPLLDGSARDWLSLLGGHLGMNPPEPAIAIPGAIFHRHNDDICVYAIPDTHFKVSYSINFNHKDLQHRWVRWDSRQDAVSLVADAGTFGYLDELPALQAKGLALGANLENSLGLTAEGGYTRPLRHEDEPVYHKILDLIGDLSLSGINPLALKAHVFAINAGHGSHVAFAHRLLQSL